MLCSSRYTVQSQLPHAWENKRSLPCLLETSFNMADSGNSDILSFMGLEEELTCSICLCAFDCPVTIPCGHNFCQDCILATWKESYNCPQCRKEYDTQPELKKNTVLSAIVEAFTITTKHSKIDPSPVTAEVEVKTESFPLCDTCMVSKAFKTCLTCMTSFCAEHFRPHQENPNLRLHQLSEPLVDLQDRICQDHYRLMEFFCVQHGRSICSFCLQQVHKGCTFSTPDEQRAAKQSDFKQKLLLLDGKIEKTNSVISQVQDLQNRMKDTASQRKRVYEAEFQQMREMLDREEREALNTVDREQQSAQMKLDGFLKKFTMNVEKMSDAKTSITSLLGQSHTVAFLQATVDLPSVVTIDPFAPRVTMDTKPLLATHAFTSVLKEHLGNLFKQPVEARLAILRPGERTASVTGGLSVFSSERTEQPGAGILGELPLLPGFPKHVRCPSPGAPLRAGHSKRPQKHSKKPPQEYIEKMSAGRSMESLLNVNRKDKARGRPAEKPKENAETASVPPNITSAEKRHELLKYGAVLTLDPKTAHKRVRMSEDFTTASVSDEPADYPDGPARFSVCSQVLTSRGFSSGRHYWEVKMSSNNFIGIGLAYNSIDRKGPASRLGRNAQSWCVEWFNVKLSAWHASSETVLANPNPKRVGVLLDCEGGTATFYNVADRAYPFHTFVFPFAEAVYPAFWVFSSGSSINLCKLQ